LPTNAPNATSFLRLARIPFEGKNAEGETLQLLRIETDEAVDIGSMNPHLGGASMRYGTLPAKLISRRRLAFVYLDGKTARSLSFAEALALSVALWRVSVSIGPTTRAVLTPCAPPALCDSKAWVDFVNAQQCSAN
jgi:hypothetical protein